MLPSKTGRWHRAIGGLWKTPAVPAGSVDECTPAQIAQAMDALVHIGRTAAQRQVGLGAMHGGLGPALDPDGAQAQRAGGLLVHQAVLDQHAARGFQLQTRQDMPEHAPIRLGTQLAEHGHLLQRDHTLEGMGQAHRVQHPPGISVGPVGQQELAAGQAGQGRQVMGMAVQVRGFDAGWQGECRSGPPVSRSDWQLQDGGKCLYVHGPRPVARQDAGKPVLVKVNGVLKTAPNGVLYLDAR